MARKRASKKTPPEQRENPEITDVDAIVTSEEAVIETAKEQHAADDEPMVVTLLHGAKATLHPVPPALITDVSARIKDPPVPKVYIKDKDRYEENPNHPTYIAALERAELERTQAQTDAIIMFGVELEEGFEIPDRWVKKLKVLGFEFDEDEPEELEFAFKKYGVTNAILIRVSALTGVTEEGLAAADQFFRG